MTIKEVEQLLEVPRATIRFYEKQGLIAPARGENGYRDYTDEDFETLKKIIILRKIGMTVEEIRDLFDGIQSMDKALDANIENLQKQMDELKGAIKLSQKMKEDIVQLDSMNVNAYWHTIEEEENQGNRFIDIAKDIIEIERGVFTSYLMIRIMKYSDLAQCGMIYAKAFPIEHWGIDWTAENATEYLQDFYEQKRFVGYIYMKKMRKC